jgi:hypothetical protein
MKIKISPDKERAKSILGLIGEREDFVKSMKGERFSTIIAENYYEIIKELCTAIALTVGWKFIGENAHKDLFEFIRGYKFGDFEMEIMNDLRVRRNKSSYEGKPIEEIYLENKKEDLLRIIKMLKDVLGELL